jgi:hypothetical protein
VENGRRIAPRLPTGFGNDAPSQVEGVVALLRVR